MRRATASPPRATTWTAFSSWCPRSSRARARLSSELSQAVQELYGQQWQDAQEALTGARAAVDQRQEEFDHARRDLQACEEGVGARATATEERRRDIAAREEAHRNLEEYRRD